MLKTTKLREILLAAHGPMTLDQVRAQVANPGEALQWLVDAGLVIITPKGFHALDGLGNPVQPGGVRHGDESGQNVKTPGRDKGFRGSITTPVMASRASAGGSAPKRFGPLRSNEKLSYGSARRTIQMNKAREEKMPRILEAIRGGMTLQQAYKSVGLKSWAHTRNAKPEEWKAIEEAQQEWRKRNEDLAKEFRRKLHILLKALGSATIDQIFEKTQGWEIGRKHSRYSVEMTLRAMRAMKMADFTRTGRYENKWRAT